MIKTHKKLYTQDALSNIIYEDIIRIPYHKPYNRDSQKSLDEQLIEEGIEEYQEQQQELKHEQSTRYLQTQVRLIKELAEYVGQDLSTLSGRNAVAELWIDCGYAERYRNLYDPKKVVTLKEVLDYK